jgi:hypothetical protein
MLRIASHPRRIVCRCSTDGPDIESFRNYEGRHAELEQVARIYAQLLEVKWPCQTGKSHKEPLMFPQEPFTYVSKEVRHEREKTIRF